MELSNPGMFAERSGWSGRDRIAEIHRLPPRSRRRKIKMLLLLKQTLVSF
jgi:hypothetical protein